MFMINIEGLQVKIKVAVKCDDCGKINNRRISSVKASRKKREIDKDYCVNCAAKIASRKNPQCGKDFWQNEERKRNHSKSIKSSVLYYNAIANRPSLKGENNPMWGKRHTEKTKNKMSKSRIGKTGENATAWKGGKKSLNQRVKSALQRKNKWFHKVMDRDKCICQHCGATKNLDAHHISPISTIIVNLLKENTFVTESEKIDWLIIQPEIADKDLKNGLTLCRTCHKKIHQNWGSHEPQIR